VSINYSVDEIKIPVESKAFPGYFEVEGYSWVAIRTDGQCVCTLTGKKLALSERDDYIAIGTTTRKSNGSTPADYRDVRLTALVHRLLALAFIGRPAHLRHISFEELEVNHIDHNKKNLALNNLEWKTRAGNARAARDFGVHRQSLAVLAKNILTEEVTRFTSIRACASHFDINQYRLADHLRSEEFGLKTKDWHIFKFDNGRPWPIMDEVDQVESKWFNNGFVELVNIDGTQTHQFSTILEVAEFLGMNHRHVRYHHDVRGTEVPLLGWFITYYPTVVGYDVSKLKPRTRHVNDIGAKRGEERRKVKIIDFYTNTEMIFPTIGATANFYGMPHQALQFSLRNNTNLSSRYKAQFVDD
jgi:hypothetical protein